MKKAKAIALDDQPRVVLTLLAAVLLINMFLFAVAYSNASFHGVERALPDPFAPAKISQQLDQGLNIVAENLNWSFSTSVALMQPKVVALLGLEGYSYQEPQGQVLGASTVNPSYVEDNILVVQPIPQFNELVGIFSQ